MSAAEVAFSIKGIFCLFGAMFSDFYTGFGEGSLLNWPDELFLVIVLSLL